MKLEIITDDLLYEFSDSIKKNYGAEELRYIIRFFIGFGYNDCCSYVRNVQSRNRVIWSGAKLLWSERELTTKVGNNLGLSSCTVP